MHQVASRGREEASDFSADVHAKMNGGELNGAELKTKELGILQLRVFPKRKVRYAATKRRYLEALYQRLNYN